METEQEREKERASGNEVLRAGEVNWIEVFQVNSGRWPNGSVVVGQELTKVAVVGMNPERTCRP